MHEVVCKDVPKLNSIHDLKTFGRKKNEKNYDVILIFNRLQIMNGKLLRYIYTIYVLIPFQELIQLKFLYKHKEPISFNNQEIFLHITSLWMKKMVMDEFHPL